MLYENSAAHPGATAAHHRSCQGKHPNPLFHRRIRPHLQPRLPAAATVTTGAAEDQAAAATAAEAAVSTDSRSAATAAAEAATAAGPDDRPVPAADTAGIRVAPA
ncbi:MAG: hypothetical protein WA851_16600, partial [Xanthobacteraceae bacterium]